MRNIIFGVLLGVTLSGTLVGAGQFYDRSGQPNAPSGSVQQFDYFRGRQNSLDLNAMRRTQEESMRAYPCAR